MSVFVDKYVLHTTTCIQSGRHAVRYFRLRVSCRSTDDRTRLFYSSTNITRYVTSAALHTTSLSRVIVCLSTNVCNERKTLYLDISLFVSFVASCRDTDSDSDSDSDSDFDSVPNVRYFKNDRINVRKSTS